ncbi:MAG: OmpH family outer membrane protein, partial [Ignavibacteriaceae bacterium]|nr:OmpH family outer membrane protein [Ignavibacteriaceae bacterium]
LLTLLAILAVATFLSAQTPVKIGYVDSQVILTQFSEAIKAQGDLDALTQKWSNQLDSMTQAYQQGLADYQKQANNMPDDKKLAAQQVLIKKEQDIVDFRKMKFGQQTGEIYAKQEEIFNPVKEKIYKAIENVAKEESMQFVFDKSGDIILLYADSAFDVTFKVLDKLKRGNK